MQRILAIDDDSTILLLLERCLGSMEYEVDTVDHPRDGLRLIQENDYSMVIIDVMLPETDGITLFKEICRIKRLPTLFLTVAINCFSADKAEVLELWEDEFSRGMTDILYKPFPFRLIREKVEGLVGPADYAPLLSSAC